MSGGDEQRVRALYDGRADGYAEFAAARTGYPAHVARFLEAHARPGGRVLDVGCGPGNLTAHLDGAVAVSGLDLSPRMIALARRARPAGTWEVGSFHRPFPPALAPPFDAVLMIGSFEFCEDLPGVIGRLAGAARPGGALLLGITERADDEPPALELPAPDVEGRPLAVQRFTPGEMQAAFSGAALEPIRCEHVHGWTHAAGAAVTYALWVLRKPR
ncbi:MAG: methyltransferase domain-containing protein [Anaeromyxobacteraceae bacterium]